MRRHRSLDSYQITKALKQIALNHCFVEGCNVRSSLEMLSQHRRQFINGVSELLGKNSLVLQIRRVKRVRKADLHELHKNHRIADIVLAPISCTLCHYQTRPMQIAGSPLKWHRSCAGRKTSKHGKTFKVRIIKKEERPCSRTRKIWENVIRRCTFDFSCFL